MSNNLGGERVNEGQVSKELTINDGMGTLDAAITEVVAIDLSAGSVATTAAVLNSAAIFTLNPAAAATLTLAAVKRRLLFLNQGTAIATLALGTASIAIPAGAATAVALIGTANGLYPETVVVAAGSDSGSGGSGVSSSAISASYWRVRFVSEQSGNVAEMGQVVFKDAAGEVIPTNNGTAFSSSNYASTNFSLASAFNGTGGTSNTPYGWAGADGTSNLGYQFPQAVAVASVSLLCGGNGSYSEGNGPNAFVIEYSADGVTYETALSTNAAPWQTNVPQVFQLP